MPSLFDKLASANGPSLETVDDCFLCGGKTARFLFWGVDRFHHLPGRFGVIECQGCELVRLSPRPRREDIAKYYPDAEYYSYQSLGSSSRDVSSNARAAIQSAIRKSALSKLGYKDPQVNTWEAVVGSLALPFVFERAAYGFGSRLPHYKRGGRALDVGCGNGFYLSVLKTLGWQVAGIEMSEKAARSAMDSFGIEVFVGNIESAPFDRSTFDHIAFFHSLEHMYEPFEALSKARELLRGDGILYVEVPNIKGSGPSTEGKFWMDWDPPRHLWGFSPRSLTQLIERAGFSVNRITTKSIPNHRTSAYYRVEEELGRMTTPRGEISKTRLWMAGLKGVYSSLYTGVFRQSGNHLCVWANPKA